MKASKTKARKQTLRTIFLSLLLCWLSLAQNEPLMRGYASQQGVDLTFETRLEPSIPPFADKFVGGTVTDPVGIHRYLAYNSLRKFFGYDLQVARQPLGYAYDVTFRPLSISPARLELENPASWTIVPLSGYPAPQVVRAGATVALDLFTNPATGQKIVEYIHFAESRRAVANVIRPGDQLSVLFPRQPQFSRILAVKPDGYISTRFTGELKAAGLTPQELSASISSRLPAGFKSPAVNVQVVRTNQKNGPPHDFSLEDAELRITAPRITFNGRPLAITTGYKGSVSGRVVWFYLPQSGHYSLSLLPHQSKGFTNAGEVQGGTLTFTIDNETLELNCNADIAPGSGPYNLYVRHSPAWQPNDAAQRSNFLLGSVGDPDSVEVVQVSGSGSKCYISGEVVRPGAYPLTAPKTIYEALTEAGGLTDFAKGTKIYVLRGGNKIPFNYHDVSRGKNLAQNVLLQSGDVIVVP